MKKMMHVPGDSSMIGMVTTPQLSPATIVWMKVRIAALTDSKACGQRSQLSYVPLAAILRFTSWSQFTARIPWGLHYLSSATCLIRPRLFSTALLV